MLSGLFKNTARNSEEDFTTVNTMEEGSHTIKISSSKFIKTVKVFVENPHLINKKICGVDNRWVGIGAKDFQINSAVSKLTDFIQDKNNICNITVDSLFKVLNTLSFQSYVKNDGDNFEIPWNQDFPIAVIRNIMPKNIEFYDSIMEVIIIDFIGNGVLFISDQSPKSLKLIPDFAYLIHLKDDKMQLKTFKEINLFHHGLKWLDFNLIPTLTKWAKQTKDEGSDVMSVPSLSLVNILNYNKTYQDLKRKYGKHLMEIWTETTDPQKFIYEDFGIAAYLISIWEEERISKGLKEKQTFLDLGCGNGLLVYILNSEGYCGMGIDIKKRKLWDKFTNVHLKEDVILPSDKCLYPDYDWLIGNHSDELTPWLPVISAKSSLTSRYFLMPCCAYDFQSKFQRSKSGISQYAEYLDYIQELGSICGFEVWRDKLRIPSTKRTCFIGQNRIYKPEEWGTIISRINEFILSRCNSVNNLTSSPENWCSDFKPREAIQKTRNCTQLNTQVRDKLINDIGFLLLSQQNIIQIQKGSDTMKWNKGGVYSFKNLINDLNKDELKHLKSECGGLQTLLRNHKYIFKIEKGNISLRIPEPRSERSVRFDLINTKACWFDLHHPHGCILSDEDCTYIHA